MLLSTVLLPLVLFMLLLTNACTCLGIKVLVVKSFLFSCAILHAGKCPNWCVFFFVLSFSLSCAVFGGFMCSFWGLQIYRKCLKKLMLHWYVWTCCSSFLCGNPASFNYSSAKDFNKKHVGGKIYLKLQW